MATSEIILPIPHSQPESIHGPRLTGGWRIAGMSVWAVIWLFSLWAFFVANTYWFTWDSTPITILAIQNPKISPEIIAKNSAIQAEVYQLGISLPFYGGLLAGLRLLASLPYFLLSVLIIRRRSDRLVAVLFAIILAVLGAAGRWAYPNWMPLPGIYPWIKIPILVLAIIMDFSVILFYTFPDGRFVPRWTRWVALAWILNRIIVNFFPNMTLSLTRLPLLAIQLLNDPLFISIGLFAMVYRYRRQADAKQKQQIKWMILGVALLFIFYSIGFIITYNLATEPSWSIAQALFAVCIGISLFRYRLWEIDLVINRVLVYGSLSLLTIGIYIGAVMGLGSLFRDITSPLVFFAATALIAILFNPMHRRLQRLVNRLMYGDRDEPYTVLTQLANLLGQSATPNEILPTIAETVSQAMKIPYVSILIYGQGGDHLVAKVGQKQEDLLSFQLVYQAEVIGVLQVGRRAPSEGFSKADLRLLENIAQQAGSAAETIRLNAELVRSRAEIVTTREEERRRLRRDLHDGLGPILASQTLKMAAVRQMVWQNPKQAETMLDDIIEQAQNTVSEVRRLVYGLRPPALDELGLVEAVRDLVHRTGPDGNSIVVEGPKGGLPKLPAAVEANAYRIALEGLTNSTRHAKAQRCIIRFTIEEQQQNEETKRALVVQISDDGTGMPAKYRAGVGIRSMRERAEELGGQLVITAGKPHGTQVSAWLPIAETN